MLAAVFCFALLDATSKHLAQTFAVPLLAWIRYATHLALMVILLAPSRRAGLMRTSRPGAQIVRGLMLAGTTLFFMAALRLMPLAETTALSFIAPPLVALAAGPILGEKVGPGRWMAVLAGFAGVVLIAHPGSPGGDITAAGLGFALAGALCYSIYQLQTRLLSPTEDTLTLLFYTALAGTVALSVSLPWVWGGPKPSSVDAALMVAMGVLGGTGHLLLTRAFRYAPASLLSPFTYVQLVWATLLGWLVFQHVPDMQSLAGIAIIAGSGLAIAAGRRRTP